MTVDSELTPDEVDAYTHTLRRLRQPSAEDYDLMHDTLKAILEELRSLRLQLELWREADNYLR